MAIPHLTPDQIREWPLEKKDRWWLENVYRGDMPQLTLRSALTGVVLGGVLSLTNLYVGIRTGWTLGVGITSVVLAYAAFKLLSGIGLGRDLTILENNAMQSIATSAGYMTAPLIASIPAYMLVTSRVIPPWQVILWISALPILGVLFAFPLKKRFINDEQLPFPEGYAAGVVMDSLHASSGALGLMKAKVLLWHAVEGVAVALVLMATGLSARMRDLAERVTRFRFLQSMLHAVQYFVVAAVLTFPLGVYDGFYREHRYGLANQDFGGWFGDQLSPGPSRSSSSSTTRAAGTASAAAWCGRPST